jgi:hypothetical protein
LCNTAILYRKGGRASVDADSLIIGAPDAAIHHALLHEVIARLDADIHLLVPSARLLWPFFKSYLTRTGWPRFEEIARKVGQSTAAVQRAWRKLLRYLREHWDVDL